MWHSSARPSRSGGSVEAAPPRGAASPSDGHSVLLRASTPVSSLSPRLLGLDVPVDRRAAFCDSSRSEQSASEPGRSRAPSRAGHAEGATGSRGRDWETLALSTFAVRNQQYVSRMIW